MSDPTTSPLLSYFINNASGNVPGQTGSVIIAITPATTGSPRANNVVFTVPYKGMGSIFSDQPTAENTSSGDWSISTSNIVGTNAVKFTLTNEVLGDTVENSFTFELSGTINNFSGASEITFVESSDAASGGNPSFTQKNGSLSLQGATAAAPILSITSFTATAATAANNDGSPLIPITEFAAGAGFQLLWTADEATSYTVYQGNSAKAVYSGSATTAPVSSGINQATTFTLIATGDQGKTAMRTLTITVSNPEYASLQVDGSTTLGNDAVNDSVTVNAALTNNGGTILNGGLSVGGTSSLGGTTLGSLSVTGDTTANGDLNVAGATSLGATAISGAASLTSTLNVTGDATVGGNLTVAGKGGKTFMGEGIISGNYLVVNNAFSQAYRYYEVIMDNILPTEGNAFLQAQLYVKEEWIDTYYSVVSYANDSGSETAASYLNESSVYLWPPSQSPSDTNVGVFGNLTFYNPAGIGAENDYEVAYMPYTGLLFGPRAYKDYGCIILSGGAASIGNPKDGSTLATGIRFGFSTGSVSSGTVRVYGWN